MKKKTIIIAAVAVIAAFAVFMLLGKKKAENRIHFETVKVQRADIATSVTANYKTCAYGFPCPASIGWQYPKRLGHDAALPEVMLGSVSGGSSTSGPRDGFYIEKYSANQLREWPRWGALSTGLGNAGLSCCTGGNGLGHAYWSIGGRLSVTGNRGEYQAAA